MYRNYEEYMQTVLGYNKPNTYRETNNFYNNVQVNQNVQEINKFYPEIYGIVYPVVQRVCSRRNVSNVTEEMISQMVDEVYRVIEPEEMREEAPLKNGDVRNPRARETRQPISNRNRLLRDLIRILILREIFGRPRLSRKTSVFQVVDSQVVDSQVVDSQVVDSQVVDSLEEGFLEEVLEECQEDLGGFPGGGPGGMPGGPRADSIVGKNGIKPITPTTTTRRF